MNDQQREAVIDREFMLMAAAQTPEQRRKHWEVMQYQIANRTPERVRQMEAEKGLSHDGGS